MYTLKEYQLFSPEYYHYNFMSSNKVIVKNASMLYMRMFISMAISFYTSRIVLQALGVSDYGIYNLVGGIVVLANMLTSSLSGATSRYITYSLGEKDFEKTRRTFYLDL